MRSIITLKKSGLESIDSRVNTIQIPRTSYVTRNHGTVSQPIFLAKLWASMSTFLESFFSSTYILAEGSPWPASITILSCSTSESISNSLFSSMLLNGDLYFDKCSSMFFFCYISSSKVSSTLYRAYSKYFCLQ